MTEWNEVVIRCGRFSAILVCVCLSLSGCEQRPSVPSAASDSKSPKVSPPAASPTADIAPRPDNKTNSEPVVTFSWKPSGPADDASVCATMIEDPAERAELERVIHHALAQHPERYSTTGLKEVVVCRTLAQGDGQLLGRIISAENGRIALAREVDGKVQSDIAIESSLHWQMAYLLLRSNPPQLDRDAWKKCNPAGFEYSDKSRAGALYLTTELTDGFISSRGRARLDADVAEYSQELFMGSESLWAAAKVLPPVKKKLDLTLQFYEKLDTRLTKKYFQDIARAKIQKRP